MDAAEKHIGEQKQAEDGSRFQIVVLDRGFVYVGRVKEESGWIVIRGAKNVRYWGTKAGLGELALKGPQANTILDAVGTVRAKERALISLIDTEESKWNSR
jgi:hypothetical protein